MESSNSPHQIEDNWVAKDYSETVAPFVSELTETVVDWLNPLAGGQYTPVIAPCHSFAK